jgi:GNAT superfamily N-acetyltransferase
MCDEWMPQLQYPLTWEDYQTLPRNPAYKYEYINGNLLLSPRPCHFHAELDLHAYQAEPVNLDGIHLRPMRPADRLALQKIFAWAFEHTQPFGSLNEERRLEAARTCLEKTWSHGDGPWVEEVSFVAAHEENDHPLGAIFITLLPGGDPANWDSFYWVGPPPPDCIMRHAGQPHLTWIFVAPVHGKRGLGSALLEAAVQALVQRNYATLWTTFMDGNLASMLWHWRNGFRLLGHPGSRRRRG